MKRRDFLKILGITATTPMVGSEIVASELKVFTEKIDAPIIKPMSSHFLNNEIYFKNIGTFGLDDHAMTMTEHRGVAEYHSLGSISPVKLPTARGANMDVRIYATPNEMNKFKHYFEGFKSIEEVRFELKGLSVLAKDVVIQSISVVHEMDKPLALDLTLMLQTEKVSMKEV